MMFANDPHMWWQMYGHQYAEDVPGQVREVIPGSESELEDMMKEWNL